MNAQPSSAPVASTSAIPDSETISSAPTAPAIAPVEEQSKRGGFAALQSRNFVLLWTGLIVSNVGTWMAGTAEGWLVTDLKGDRAAFSLGLIAISFAVPLILLPPVGGVVADRVPRLKLLWVAQLLYLALSIGLAVLTITDVINVGFLMANIQLIPGARADDGILDVVVASPRTLRDWVRLTTRVLARRRQPDDQLDRLKGRRVTITVEERDRVQLDGDTVGECNTLTAEVVPAALRLRVPRLTNEPSIANGVPAQAARSGRVSVPGMTAVNRATSAARSRLRRSRR